MEGERGEWKWVISRCLGEYSGGKIMCTVEYSRVLYSIVDGGGFVVFVHFQISLRSLCAATEWPPLISI